METLKKTESESLDITISPNDGHNWSREKEQLVDVHVMLNHAKRSPDRIRKNKMLAVLYRMEEYLQYEDIKADDLLTIEYFVREFCKVLGLNKTQFAKYLDTDISNLNKYYNGQRPFNTDLALKFGHFFHTPVDVWLKLQLKNDLIILETAQADMDKYRKYDYEKLQTA
jgi:plasmid maintenance system antidote protein VapI